MEHTLKKKHLTIKELPLSERPYEKFEKYGVNSLSDAELLAVIIRSGTKGRRSIEVASAILNVSKRETGLLNLHTATEKELMEIEGIGRVKAIQLLCVAELSKRISRETKKKRLALLTPEAVAEYYMEDMRHLKYEQVILLLLDIKNRIIKDVLLSKGNGNCTTILPRDIMTMAIKYEAFHYILLHNHPSGDPTPSGADIAITKRLIKAGELIGIQLLDHIIIGDNKYVSFKERGVF